MKLKPCPFCGKQPIGPIRESDIVTLIEDENSPWVKDTSNKNSWSRKMKEINRKEYWHIYCEMHASIYGESEETAIEAWNKREGEE